MRFLTKFEDESVARKFSAYLFSKSIENSIDSSIDEKSKKNFFNVWVYEEDDFEEAKQKLSEFLENPSDKKFVVQKKDFEKKEKEFKEEIVKDEKPELRDKNPFQVKNGILKSFWFTNLMMIFCVFVYLINSLQEMRSKRTGLAKDVFVTPIQYYMMFDIPDFFIKVSEIINKHKIDSAEKLKELEPQIEEEISELERKTNYFRGFYNILVLKISFPKSSWAFSGPMFEKISKGQIWRLITPCFLHKSFIHLLFNMLWLWLLGWQMEQRISRFKFLLLVLIVGVLTNVCQYLMSGSNFLGFSGVVMGMVGFIWSRQKVAPWEGYPLQRISIIFLAAFVIIMCLMQLVSLVMMLFGYNFNMPIANTAHIVGAIIGIILGRMSFFAWRPIEQ